MKVSIIIPNWNGRALLEKNLPLVLSAADKASNEITEVIVVDDSSPDDSVEFVKKNYNKQVRLVQLKRNKGFAGAVNMGVYAAKSPLICLLNIDVVPQVGFLNSIHELFKDEAVFAVTLHEKGYGPAVGGFDNGFIVHKPGRETGEVQESFWASGGSAVFKRSVWLKLKGLDDELFSPFYWEDVDLGYRAWKRGYKILWDPKAMVEHKHESVINADYFSKRYLNSIKDRNYLLFNWKNITSGPLWKKHKLALYKYILRHPGYLRIVFMAWAKKDVLKKKREKEKRHSKVSDEAIFARFNK